MVSPFIAFAHVIVYYSLTLFRSKFWATASLPYVWGIDLYAGYRPISEF